MPISDALAHRINELDSEMMAVAAKERGLATSAYLWSQGLFILALVCSVAAAVCGIFFDVSAKVVGGIAALPPLIHFCASNLKLDARFGWHYRKYYAMVALHSRLRFQLPEEPTADNVAAIAKDRDHIVEVLEDDWKKTAATSYGEILRQAESSVKAQSSGTSAGQGPAARGD